MSGSIPQESILQTGSGSNTMKKAKSTFLHEGSFGCAYTPPLPCRKGKKTRSRSLLRTRLVGKILPKADVGVELSLTHLIRSIPDYEKYYIVQEEESCDARNFFLARDTYAGECKLYQRKKDGELAQLVSPYGGTALHKSAFGHDFDYMKSFKHLLRGVAQLNTIGICHFDLHMANVLRDYEGTIRIIDFGISFAIPNLTKAMIEQRQVEFSPGYAVEAPDLTIQRAIFDGINLDIALNMLMKEKKVLPMAASVLGLSLEEQKEALRRFCLEDRSMREHNWLEFYKAYAFKWDAWCVGMIFMYILHDLLLQTWFVTTVWHVNKEKIRKVLRGLLRTDPRQRLSATDALTIMNA